MPYIDLVKADLPSLYWPLNSTYGANDQSGNSRNGTAGGGVTAGGFSGSPVAGDTTSTDFNGSTHRFTSSYNPFTNATTRTFTGWAYRDTNSSYDIICASSGGALLGLGPITTDNDDVFLSANGGSYATWAAANKWPGNGQWVHWAIIFNEATDTAELYLNGVSQGTKTHSVAWATGTLVLGADTGVTLPFDGKMAHFAIFERALTASEIQGHYRAAADTSSAQRPYVHQAGRSQ